MKNIYFFILACVIASCNNTVILSDFNTLKGSGNVITKTIEVNNIAEIENTGVFNIILTNGDKQNIRIETDDNILQYIKYQVVQSRLVFSLEKNVENDNIQPTKANIYINSNQINLIENSGVSNISIENYKYLGTLTINNSGVGNINSINIDGGNLNISNSGVGNINLKGKLSSLILSHHGVGTIDAFDLPADTIVVKNSGVGNVNVYANKEISIENSGVGSVEFKGNPTVKSLDVSGVGKVKKKKQ